MPGIPLCPKGDDPTIPRELRTLQVLVVVRHGSSECRDAMYLPDLVYKYCRPIRVFILYHVDRQGCLYYRHSCKAYTTTSVANAMAHTNAHS